VRRSAGFELGVGVVVLLVTAVLVATPPPIDDEVFVNGYLVDEANYSTVNSLDTAAVQLLAPAAVASTPGRRR
jgi:hypothetical protein